VLKSNPEVGHQELTGRGQVLRVIGLIVMSLSPKVEQGGYKLLPVTQPCVSTTTVYVPVYVPR